MLRETEWNTVNQILLDIYKADTVNSITRKVMQGLRLMIPYSKGYFLLFGEEQKPLTESVHTVGFATDNLIAYIDRYYDEDYLRYLTDPTTRAPVYQETNILMDNVRKFTPFFTNFLEPNGCHQGAGLLFIRDSHIIGILELFRDEKVADFNERDIYVLNTLKAHIENIIFRVIQASSRQVMYERCFRSMKRVFSLTTREVEILRLVSSGLSSKEICEQLVISTSTAKKHIYNIYTKTGVKSRTQLMNLLYSM